MDENFSALVDSEYADTGRALVMAYNSKDIDLLSEVVVKSLNPLLAQPDGIQKMIFALVRGYHSLAFAMSVICETDVPEVIRMDATADYKVQEYLQDRMESGEDI